MLFIESIRPPDRFLIFVLADAERFSTVRHMCPAPFRFSGRLNIMRVSIEIPFQVLESENLAPPVAQRWWIYSLRGNDRGG